MILNKSKNSFGMLALFLEENLEENKCHPDIKN
jgi:hypothetical protein